MLRCAGAGGVAIALFVGGTAAQNLDPVLPLPELERCSAAAHPRLPDKWRAAFLMAPFTQAQLVLADVVHDQKILATRVKLYGLRRGSADVLIVGSETYVLASTGSGVECRNLGDTGWRSLPQDWLTPQSHCSTSAPIAETQADWWKTPIEPAPATDWIWFKTSDRTPFRLVFQSPSNRLAVLSHYASSHQVRFEPLAQTELAGVAATCKGARAAPSRGASALRRELDAMARARERADGEIERIMPALCWLSGGAASGVAGEARVDRAADAVRRQRGAGPDRSALRLECAGATQPDFPAAAGQCHRAGRAAARAGRL
jgi:hypothetical protein